MTSCNNRDSAGTVSEKKNSLANNCFLFPSNKGPTENVLFVTFARASADRLDVIGE